VAPFIVSLDIDSKLENFVLGDKILFSLPAQRC